MSCFWFSRLWKWSFYSPTVWTNFLWINVCFSFNNCIIIQCNIEPGWVRIISRSTFRTQLNSKDETFPKNNWRLYTVKYFCKKLHFRCLTGFWIRLCIFWSNFSCKGVNHLEREIKKGILIGMASLDMPQFLSFHLILLENQRKWLNNNFLHIS